MVQCLVAFTDFCFATRLSAHDTDTLHEMEQYLRRFQDLRDIFRDEDIRDTFSLPRQHALVHYVHAIRLFGSLNGLCSSITESAHIRAVKDPWRRSNRRKALRQILTINTRVHKMRAARTFYGSRGLLVGDVYSQALREAALEAGVELDEFDDDDEWVDIEEDEDAGPNAEVAAVQQDFEPPSVQLTKTYGGLSLIYVSR